jgi:hypothetical protein
VVSDIFKALQFSLSSAWAISILFSPLSLD